MAEEFKRPGWYPDPDGIPGERWWNGSGWSDSRRGGAPTQAPGPTAVTHAAPPITPPIAPATAAPVVYSAENPAPQHPDPYGRPLRAAVAARTIDARANRNAMVGFITGLIALLASFFILGPVAIVFSVLGITRANQLKAEGKKNTLMTFALVGLGSGVLATILGIVTTLVFFVAIWSGS